MKPRNTLVVFYSRTGRTRQVARELAEKLDADIDEIIDLTPRQGLFRYFRAGFDAFFQRKTELQPTTRNPDGYALVVLATPIWNTSVSAPMRAYLRGARGKLRQVAFLVTHDRVGSSRVFRQMTELSQRAPRAVLALRRAEVEARSYGEKLADFAGSLRPAIAAADSPAESSPAA